MSKIVNAILLSLKDVAVVLFGARSVAALRCEWHIDGGTLILRHGASTIACPCAICLGLAATFDEHAVSFRELGHWKIGDDAAVIHAQELQPCPAEQGLFHGGNLVDKSVQG